MKTAIDTLLGTVIVEGGTIGNIIGKYVDRQVFRQTINCTRSQENYEFTRKGTECFKLQRTRPDSG